jgi:hypothetical protein
MSNVLRIAKEGKVEAVSPDVAAALGTWDLRAMLLQALIPLGLEAACALVEEECMRWPAPGTLGMAAIELGGGGSGASSIWRTRSSPCASPRVGSEGKRRGAAADVRPAPAAPRG